MNLSPDIFSVKALSPQTHSKLKLRLTALMVRDFAVSKRGVM